MKIPALSISAVLAAFFATACQEEAASPSDANEEASATEEPQAAEGKDSDFFGLAIEAGESLAKERGLACRTIEIDGEAQMAIANYREDRVNFSIADGKIIKVTRGVMRIFKVTRFTG